MPTRPVRRHALRPLAALFATLMTVLLLGGLMSATTVSASAAEPTCTRPQPRTDDTIHIIGCLTDSRTTPPSAVADAEITVESADRQAGRHRHDRSDGHLRHRAAGDSTDNIGETFVVKIDRGSLPKGTKLRNPKQESLRVTLNLDSDKFVTFPIGDIPQGTLARDPRAPAGGGRAGVLPAARDGGAGLSMIFGTTGLTNFAHGELITFGAIVAFGVDRLSGDIPHLRRQRHDGQRGDRRGRRLRRLRLAAGQGPLGDRCATAAPGSSRR